MHETMADVQAIILPAAPGAAPLISEATGNDESKLDKVVAEVAFWARGINYLGVPSLTIPGGHTENGLPLGLQIIGAPLSEQTLFALGHALTT